jgi:hypothetical protein
MLKKLVFIMLLSMMANAAYANCPYEGKSHPEGTVIGPLVCSGGQWVKR